MFKCNSCDEKFDGLGTKKDITPLEWQGYKVKHEQLIDCCPRCGSTNYEEREEDIKDKFNDEELAVLRHWYESPTNEYKNLSFEEYIKSACEAGVIEDLLYI